MSPRSAAVMVVWALAFHLIAVGIMGALGGLWPPQTGDLFWRVLLQTQFLAGIGQVVAAVLVLLGFAVWVKSRAAAVAGLTLGGIFPALVGVALVTLALDYVQMRPALRPDATGRWDLSVAIPAVLGILASVVLLGLGLAAARVRRR